MNYKIFDRSSIFMSHDFTFYKIIIEQGKVQYLHFKIKYLYLKIFKNLISFLKPG